MIDIAEIATIICNGGTVSWTKQMTPTLGNLVSPLSNAERCVFETVQNIVKQKWQEARCWYRRDDEGFFYVFLNDGMLCKLDARTDEVVIWIFLSSDCLHKITQTFDIEGISEITNAVCNFMQQIHKTAARIVAKRNLWYQEEED